MVYFTKAIRFDMGGAFVLPDREFLSQRIWMFRHKDEHISIKIPWFAVLFLRQAETGSRGKTSAAGFMAFVRTAQTKAIQHTCTQPSKKERAVISSMGSFAVKETVQAPVRTAPGYHDARRAIRCSLKQISSV